MASAIYPKAKESMLQGALNMSSGTVKVAMVTSAYTYSAAHQYYSSVTGVVGTPGTLTTKTFTSGAFDADDLTFTNVAAGSTIVAAIVYIDTGIPGTSQLVAYIDGLNILSNNGNITFSWTSISPYIFTL